MFVKFNEKIMKRAGKRIVSITLLTVIFASLLLFAGCSGFNVDHDPDVETSQNTHVSLEKSLENKYCVDFVLQEEVSDINGSIFLFSPADNKEILVSAYLTGSHTNKSGADFGSSYDKPEFVDDMKDAVRNYCTSEMFESEAVTLTDKNIEIMAERIYNCLLSISDEYDKYFINDSFDIPCLHLSIYNGKSIEDITFHEINLNSIYEKLEKCLCDKGSL